MIAKKYTPLDGKRKKWYLYTKAFEQIGVWIVKDVDDVRGIHGCALYLCKEGLLRAVQSSLDTGKEVKTW